MRTTFRLPHTTKCKRSTERELETLELLEWLPRRVLVAGYVDLLLIEPEWN
jgi:hypothetical protein